MNAYDKTENVAVRNEVAEFHATGLVISEASAATIASWYAEDERPGMTDLAGLHMTDYVGPEVNALIHNFENNHNASAHREVEYLSALRAYIVAATATAVLSA